jgi:pseudaminic acid cytidylyltransferase
MRVAVIPARGGSKRIPRKNIREFAGKPMIAHSIKSALESGLFERVIVSTDDAQITKVAREWGAEVPFVRPAELSDDHTGTTEVIAHAVEWLRDKAEAPTAVCCIYATAPFITQEDLGKALAVLESGGWQYVFPATSYPAPIFRSFERGGDGGLKMFFPEHFLTRSQDLPAALHDAGQFYWGRPQAWVSRARVFDRSSTVIEIPRWRVQDVDTEEDWRRAEQLAHYLQQGKTHS